jgi:hypothetical protein
MKDEIDWVCLRNTVFFNNRQDDGYVQNCDSYCPVGLVHHDVIILIISDENYNLLSFSLHSFSNLLVFHLSYFQIFFTSF